MRSGHADVGKPGRQVVELGLQAFDAAVEGVVGRERQPVESGAVQGVDELFGPVEHRIAAKSERFAGHERFRVDERQIRVLDGWLGRFVNRIKMVWLRLVIVNGFVDQVVAHADKRKGAAFIFLGLRGFLLGARRFGVVCDQDGVDGDSDNEKDRHGDRVFFHVHFVFPFFVGYAAL